MRDLLQICRARHLECEMRIRDKSNNENSPFYHRIHPSRAGYRLARIGVRTKRLGFPPAEQPAAVSSARAVEPAAPTVVSVQSATTVAKVRNPLLNDPLFRDFVQIPDAPIEQRLETSLGSGVIVEPSGLVPTNYHLIRDADKIQVTLSDGRVADALLVGSDPETDIAVLRIKYTNLPGIEIGDSVQAKVGDVVRAIGNPLGVGQTVTQGIISATGRNRVGINAIENFIQTDAAINPGDSEGALINTRGELIPINSAIRGYPAIGFAIPTTTAVEGMNQLIAFGAVRRGWFGMQAHDLTTSLRTDLKANSNAGIVVLAVTPGGPADDAGLQSGDVITRIQGHEIRESEDAVKTISKLRPGTTAELAGTRLGHSFMVTKRPASNER
jgi:serine protease DegS